MTSYIGPEGSMVPFRCPAVLDVSQGPASSLATTLGGRVVEQRAPRGRRSWSVSVPPATRPADMSALRALVDGAYGPPPWVWIDPWAASTNLCTPGACLFEAGTTAGAGLVVTGPVVATDGTRLPASVASSGGTVTVGRPGASRGVAVAPGEAFTAALYVSGAADVIVRLTFQDGAGVGLQNTAVVLSAPSLERAVVSDVAPAGAARAVITVVDASLIAGPQITMTDGAVPWVYGQGAAWVTADQVGQSPAIATDRLQMAPVSFVVREIG